jgi:hypothetical protein
MVRVPGGVRRTLAGALAVFLWSAAAQSGELPRRPFLGVTFDESDLGGPGLLVASVQPGSTAAIGGLRPGDRLTSVGTVDDLAAAARRGEGMDLEALRRELAGAATGSRIALRWYRGARAYRVSPPLGALPAESVPGSEVRYDSVTVDGIRQRLIISVPTAGAAALVLYLADAGCESQDFWLDAEDPVKRLVDGWAARGLATARLEKRGVGDSEGPDCAELGFVAERRGYAAGVERLVELGWQGRILLFGHGTGGALAPLVATDQVGGVMVYGTFAVPWPEHLLARLARLDPERAAALAQSGWPDLPSLDGGRVLGRSAAFHRQLAEVDPMKAWSRVWQPVLALHGDCDWTATAGDQERIARLTGGKFLSLAGLDHQFLRYASPEQCFASPGTGRFDPLVVTATATWIQALPLVPVVTDGDGRTGS